MAVTIITNNHIKALPKKKNNYYNKLKNRILCTVIFAVEILANKLEKDTFHFARKK